MNLGDRHSAHMEKGLEAVPQSTAKEQAASRGKEALGPCRPLPGEGTLGPCRALELALDVGYSSFYACGPHMDDPDSFSWA